MCNEYLRHLIVGIFFVIVLFVAIIVFIWSIMDW